MTDVYHDRIKETGTGTNGTITLLGAVAQYASFSRVGNGNTCRYTVVDADGIKWGSFGGVWSTGGTLSRVTTYESSNGVGVAVTFSGGTHQVFLTPDSTQFPTSGAPPGAAGSPTQVQYNKANALAGDAGFTYDETTNVLTLNGSANSLNLVGSATTAPVLIEATGTDASIPIQLKPKGPQGYIQAGPDTYGAAGWAGSDLNVEIYEAVSRTTSSAAIYVEKYAKDVNAAQIFGLSFVVGSQASAVNGANIIEAINGTAYSYAPVGVTNSRARGILIGAGQSGAGTVTTATALDAVVQSSAGVVTAGHGVRVESAIADGGGTITTNYGLKVENQTVGGTNYSCHFGSGLYHFDALTASQLLATDASKNLVSFQYDTDGTLAANSDSRIPTQKAVKTYVDASVVGLLQFQGNTDCSANPNYPAALKGDAYYVSVAGKIGGASGKSVEVGDVYVANADNAGGTEAGVGTSWFVLEHNLVGAVVQGGALGTPSSGTLTNCTGLPVAGITPSTTQALGVGSLELGHASDTTLARSGAGDVTVEGNLLYRAGGTDVPITDGGTGASTAAGAVTNLGLDNTKIATITFVIDGGGSAITTGIKGDLEIPFACTINRVTTLLDQSGSIVVDIWKDTYANYPPVVGDSITASAKPTVSATTKAQDSTLTGWTTSIAAGDTLRFNVDSITTATRATISLKVTKT